MSSQNEIARVFKSGTELEMRFGLGEVWGVEISPDDIVYRPAPFDDAPYPDVTISTSLLRLEPLETVLVFDELVDRLNRLFDEEGMNLRIQFMAVARYIGNDPEPEEVEIAESGDLRETLERAEELEIPEGSHLREVLRRVPVSRHYRLVYMNVPPEAFRPDKRVWVD